MLHLLAVLNAYAARMSGPRGTSSSGRHRDDRGTITVEQALWVLAALAVLGAFLAISTAL